MLLLSDGRTRLDILVTKPAGWDTGSGELELPLTAFAAAIDTCGQINKPDYNLTAGASSTVPDQPLCEEGAGTAFGASTYSGSVTVLRQLTQAGAIDPASDTVYTAIGEKGAEAWYVERIGPKAKESLKAGAEGWIYHAVSDEPQTPQDRQGYIKEVIPLAIRSRRRFKIVAGGTP